MAGVKRGRGRGNLGARGRKEKKGKIPLLPPPLRVVSRSNFLPLPFRTPATQASHKLASPADILRDASRVQTGTLDEPLRTSAWEASHKSTA